MTDRKRIENPTCGSCRWFETERAGSISNKRGTCCIYPPFATFDTENRRPYYERPLVDSSDFCSLHESAFEDSFQTTMNDYLRHVHGKQTTAAEDNVKSFGATTDRNTAKWT